MTEEQINNIIAKHCCWNWYAVEKGGWYYRANSQGYTNRIEEAGKYSKEDAQKEICRGEPMSIVKIHHPDYCNDLNAMLEAQKFLEGSKNWNKYVELIGQQRFYNPDIHCFRVLANVIVSSTAKERATAFVKVLKKWRDYP